MVGCNGLAQRRMSGSCFGGFFGDFFRGNDFFGGFFLGLENAGI